MELRAGATCSESLDYPIVTRASPFSEVPEALLRYHIPGVYTFERLWKHTETHYVAKNPVDKCWYTVYEGRAYLRAAVILGHQTGIVNWAFSGLLS